MNKKFNHVILIACFLTLAGCVGVRSNVRPVLSCNAERLLGKSAVSDEAMYRSDAPDRYVVKRGDTLWGIAGRFLNAPYRWKSIWHANRQIKNPHLIYPGDVISYVVVNGQRKLQVAGSTSNARARYIGRKTADGRPVYRLSPTVRVQALLEPIPTVPKGAVYPFMTKNKIFDITKFKNSPYILNSGGPDVQRASLLFSQPHVDEPKDTTTLSLSRNQTIFAKGDSFEHEYYDVYRKGDDIYSPIQQESDLKPTREPIGAEAVYVGQVKLIKDVNQDGVATFARIQTSHSLMPNDILLPSEGVDAGGDLFFLPQLPNTNAISTIIKPLDGTIAPEFDLGKPKYQKSVDDMMGKFMPFKNMADSVWALRNNNDFAPTASQFSTLLIDTGTQQGVVEGMVYQIVRAGSTQGRDRDGKAVLLPTEAVGYAMVYKTYDNLSYALVVGATKGFNPGDCLISP